MGCEFTCGSRYLLLQGKMITLGGSTALGKRYGRTVMDPVRCWIGCSVFTCSSPVSGEETANHLVKV